jgi:hypothetical protein
MKFAVTHAGDLGIRFDCDESHESSDHDEIHKSLTIVAAVPRTSKLGYETLAQEAALMAPRPNTGKSNYPAHADHLESRERVYHMPFSQMTIGL